MDLIDREKALKVLDELIKARTCDCSKQKATERSAFEYCKVILKKLPKYEADSKV